MAGALAAQSWCVPSWMSHVGDVESEKWTRKYDEEPWVYDEESRGRRRGQWVRRGERDGDRRRASSIFNTYPGAKKLWGRGLHNDHNPVFKIRQQPIPTSSNSSPNPIRKTLNLWPG